jgi:hypothetical protein
MKKFIFHTLICCAFLFFCDIKGSCGTFDEKLWEKYAEIIISANGIKDDLVSIYLDPQKLGDSNTKTPFADLRMVTDRKEEIAWQIIEKRPKKNQEEISCKMQNLSLTPTGDTWVELVPDKPNVMANAAEIVTPNTGFSRQVEVYGSADGRNWNVVRKDGIIFDISGFENIRQTRIKFSNISFQYIAFKINNNNTQPLTVSDVKVLRETIEPEEIYEINGTIENLETNTSLKESSIIVEMNKVFPIDRLTISTTDRNFQRSLEVQIKRDKADWERLTQGVVFSFDSANIHESKLTIDIPAVAAKEFRLVFKNMDSPPLSINDVTGTGYKRLLVFKQQQDKRMYLFWGNPMAQQPQYDLSEVIAKQDFIPVVQMGKESPNSKFVGDSARLPFSERYKYFLYIFVILVIAGLIFLQYRVLRQD